MSVPRVFCAIAALTRCFIASSNSPLAHGLLALELDRPPRSRPTLSSTGPNLNSSHEVGIVQRGLLCLDGKMTSEFCLLTTIYDRTRVSGFWLLFWSYMLYEPYTNDMRTYSGMESSRKARRSRGLSEAYPDTMI